MAREHLSDSSRDFGATSLARFINAWRAPARTCRDGVCAWFSQQSQAAELAMALTENVQEAGWYPRGEESPFAETALEATDGRSAVGFSPWNESQTPFSASA